MTMDTSAFTEAVDLAAERLGGRVLAANDEFFAPKENLLEASRPIFVEDRYTDRGKWMDGWETRRRRTPGHDWCVIRLGLPGVVRGVVIDTSHFRGNYPESASLEAAAIEGDPGADGSLPAAGRWIEILPRSALRGDAQNLFEITSPYRFTHVRLNIFPDGGVARLRVHGDVVAQPARLDPSRGDIDLAALENGARVVDCSDRFFGSAHHLILPGPATHMGDGWETRRRRGPGHDWVILELAASGEIRRAEVDTSHFKGNAPGSASLEVCRAPGTTPESVREAAWSEILAQTPLEPNAVHRFDRELRPAQGITHVRFNIYPDGGVARLRLFGVIDREGRLAAGLRWLDALLDEEAEAALRRCCASSAWAKALASRRPFRRLEVLRAAADEVWWSLGREDWLEAFRAHPRLGERLEKSDRARWSAAEQSGASAASAEELGALAEANRAYESRFGHVFLVCATGKSAGEMLAICRERLKNDPERELRVAADEQRRITQLRLERLLSE
jgi:allantoicase